MLDILGKFKLACSDYCFSWIYFWSCSCLRLNNYLRISPRDLPQGWMSGKVYGVVQASAQDSGHVHCRGTLPQTSAESWKNSKIFEKKHAVTLVMPERHRVLQCAGPGPWSPEQRCRTLCGERGSLDQKELSWFNPSRQASITQPVGWKKSVCWDNKGSLIG